MEEKDNRIEALAEKIRQLNQSHSKAEEQFNLELNAQTKLIELHKVRNCMTKFSLYLYSKIYFLDCYWIFVQWCYCSV